MAGSGGSNTWPAYMQNTHMVAMTGQEAEATIFAHLSALDLDVAQDVHDAKLSNPFGAADAYDPESILDAVQTRYDTFNTIVGGLDEEVDWLSMYTKAKAGIVLDYTAALAKPDDLPREQAVIVEDVDIEAAATEFDRDNLPALMRSINRMTGPMASINAVHSSTFVLGIAKLEGEHLKRVDKQRDELKNKGKLAKQQLQAQADMREREIKSIEARERRMLVAVNQRIDKDSEHKENMTIAQQRADAVLRMVHMLTVKVDSGKGASALQAEIARITGDAYHRQADTDLEISEHDALWDLQQYTPLANFMAAIMGAPMQPKGLSKGQAVVSGALSGASFASMIGGAAVEGSAMGAVGGPMGMAIGAGVGALAGAFL